MCFEEFEAILEFSLNGTELSFHSVNSANLGN